MAIRVRDLAKEFKISSSALMKHLKDMGVDIKSPMSKIEDDIENKIRGRFNAERVAVQQRELDRRNYQQKIVQTRKREVVKPVPKKPVVVTPKPEPEAEKPKKWIEHPTRKSKDTQEAPEQEKSSRTQPPRRAGSTAPQRTRTTNQDRRPASGQDRRPATGQDRRPTSGQDRRPASGQDRRPASGQDRRPASGQDRRPASGQDRRPASGQDRRPASGQGQRPTGDRRYPPNRGRTDGRPQTQSNYRKPGGNYQSGGRGGRPQGPGGKAIPDKALELSIAEKNKAKEAKKKKKTDYGQKDRHLKAKIKSFKKSGRAKNVAPTEVEEAQIARNIKKTLAGVSQKKKKYKKEDKQGNVQDSRLTINEFTSVAELAKLMEVKPTDIIAKFFGMGKMVTINQRLDKESLELICSEFEFEVEFAEEYGSEILQSEDDEERENLETEPRPPVVTIMGHVDHGKTAILDYIRKANVIAGESGGITQHIGAYQVEYNDERITFLDTPGHAAFTAMRARGADVTDIAVIVVAANESVKTQTIEAIDHAKAAGVTMIIAINKMDLPEANFDRTMTDLMKQGLYLENYGGQTLWVQCSAKTGEGIDDLLEMILLAAEVAEISVPIDIAAKGVVIESRKNARMGTMATILLQEGYLKKGDNIVCGATYGKIRKLEDERNKELKEIGPSDIAVLFGLNAVPKAGDVVNFAETEKIARQISTERKLIRQERENYMQKTNLDNLFQKIQDAKMAEIKLIIKADTDGSVEALSDSFMKLSNEEITINIIRKAVGGINEADVTLASTLDAIIIGFNIRSANAARKLADEEKVEIKIYQIIYEAIQDIQKAMQGMMAPVLQDKLLGNARVLEVFKIKKLGQIAGSRIEKGSVKRDALLRVFRNDILIHTGKVSSLKHYSEDVDEVKSGSECGIGIENYNDLKEDDIIEAYQIIEVENTLTFD